MFTLTHKTAHKRSLRAVKGIGKSLNLFEKAQAKLLRHKQVLLDANDLHVEEIEKRNQNVDHNIAHIENINKVVSKLSEFVVTTK